VSFGAIAFVLIVVLFALVASVVPPRVRLVVWTIIVVGGVVPWASWVGHSHWYRIEWLPFSTTTRPRDIVLNILFYVPIGHFFVRRRDWAGKVRPLVGAATYALLLSLLTETSQVFSHGRFPAMTD
jgi:hypothetical protein